MHFTLFAPVLKFRRMRLSALLLIALLQRMPVLRCVVSADFVAMGSSLGQLLRLTSLTTIAVGAVDTLAGATTFSANPASPVAASVGVPFAAAFAINGTPLPVRSYLIRGLPAGLTVSGATVRPDGMLLLNSGSGIITGTPTAAGGYDVDIVAYEYVDAGGVFKGYVYRIEVRASVAPVAVAPAITSAPGPQTVSAGGAVAFNVTATGTEPLAFQWSKDGVAIAGATDRSFSISAAVVGDAGVYRVVVSNATGNATSAGAALNVTGTLFLRLTSLTFDGTGRLYASDAGHNTLHLIGSDGGVALLAGSRSNAGSANGPGAQALFNQPGGVVATSAGVLYVADTANATIRRIAADGVVTTFAGSTSVRGSADGAAGNATFFSPAALALDGSGALYVADAVSHTIRRIASDGAVSTLAGQAGAAGSADGTAGAARFNHPSGLAVDGNGTVYVADTDNNTLRKITPAGTVSTLAGLPGVSGYDDGSGVNALFNRPGGLALDAAGNLLLADTGNSIIRKITPAGAVTTFAGLPTISGARDGSRAAGGSGATALFNHPLTVAVDRAGTVLVGDTGNAAVRSIAPSGAVTTLALKVEAAVVNPPEPTPVVVVTPAPVTTPNPVVSAPASNGGGGGGGAPSVWFPLALALLYGFRRARRSFAG